MTDAARWKRIQELFHEALDKPPVERTAYLRKQCGADAELLAEVESLLGAHDEGGPVADFEEQPATPAVPDRIGPYRIIELIGRGGMGVVYLAERSTEDFRQRVAIKLLQAGFGDARLEERLRAERRILARLEHPGIARLIDGGATSAGQPWYVMEYVEGTDLLDYVRAQDLDLNRRIELYLQICDAVQYAHRQLVVHRDLKPGNIRVTPDGHAKLLDFGIAKLVDPVDESAVATRTVGWLSPAYGSPEQVRGEPISTLADVYSLGVVLYELLTDVRPYDVDTASPAEIERIVCEVVPDRPSARADDPRLRRLLTGDLDTIILKSLAKEPGRRYASVEQLADDLRRYLVGRPVLARPDSFTYRASKFVRRHRTVIAAAALVAVSLLGGTAISLWQARTATNQRNLAASEAEKATLVTGLMVDIFRLSDPTQTLGDTVTAREILDRGTERVAREFRDRPDVQAAVFKEVSAVYANLGLLKRAEDLARQAVVLDDSLYGPDSIELSEALIRLADLLAEQGERDSAVAVFQRAIPMRRAHLETPDTVLATAQANLGWVLRDLGENEAAQQLFTKALETQQALLGPGHPASASSLFGLASAYHDSGMIDSATAVFERALADYDTELGRPHPLAATAALRVGMIYRLREQFSAAVPLIRSGLDMRRSLYNPDHPAVLEAVLEWVTTLNTLAQYDEAEPLLRDAIARADSTIGPTHPTALSLRDRLGLLLVSEGRWEEGLELYEFVLSTKRTTLPPDHPDLSYSLERVAVGYIRAGRLGRAARFLDELEGRLGTGSSVLRFLLLEGRGDILARRGDLAGAARFYDAAIDMADEVLRPGHRYVLEARRARAEVWLQQGRVAEARTELESVLTGESAVRPSPHPRIGYTLAGLGEANLLDGNADEAETALREAIANLSPLPASYWRVGYTQMLLGLALRQQGRQADARPLITGGLQTMRRQLQPTASELVHAEALAARLGG